MEEEGGERGLDEGGYLLVRIHVPELNVQKCLQFPRDQLVWDVKQQCLAALPKELKESFNYGLFSPPENGRAGKFLDEERRLGDYPFNGPVGYLELKYKRRVYKTLTLDEKQLKSLHTRANLRRFLDYVHNGQVEKITKMCSKGLDPNFHCQDSGETPLTIATGIKKPSKILIALVNGGALLDYRTKDGSTAMHRSIEHKSLEAMKTLLELGASPNYKDGKGLTPLYLTITHNVDPQFTETLLHDHATTGAQDLQGWQEVHQACKIGLLQHLEHLLFYGADMNARNASGNTPLHVCAVNGQESCARQLLFRGADRQALNYANQTPCQVAVIAGNMELAEIIQNYRQEDVVPYRGPPSYNPKRRSAIGWLNRVPSMNTLALPPSPCPSDRSSAPFSSASSSLSDGSSAPPGHETDTASIVTVLALGVADKSLGDTSDIISDSSGVGTANSDTTNCSLQMPGTTVVCIESYTSKEDGHLNIREGDIIEVTGATDDGYLEGNLRSGGNKNGLFPAHCVQEVKLRHHNIQAPMMMVARDARPQSRPTPPLPPPLTVSSTITTATITTTTTITKPATVTTTTKTGRVLGRRESTSKHFATAPRVKKTYVSAGVEPRTVVLHRGRKGFGFILRGAKATSPLMELTPSEKCPALQYLDDVDPGGVADIAGLRKGDFLLEINNEDVSSASHEHVVDLIRKSGDLVQMTVISLANNNNNNNNNNTTATIINNTTTMPISKSTILPGGGNIDIPTNRQYATLPRKMSNSCGGGTLGRSHQAPLPPRRDPKTTLTVSRARAKSMVAGLETGEKDETDDVTKSSSAESIHQIIIPNGNSTPIVQPRTASIRQRPTSSRITSAELEELFQRQKDDDKQNTLMTTSRFQGNNNNNYYYSSSSPTKNRVYASVAEMKRSKSKNSKVRFSSIFSGNGELRRDFHSTPDITQEIAMLGINNNNNNSINNNKHHRSQEDLFTLMNRTLPPPTHPPPPPPLPSSSSSSTTTTTSKIPPVIQVVKVDISRNSNNNNSNSSNNNNNSQSEYNNLNNKDIQMEDGGGGVGGIVSSFRPTANAKLYASPEDMKSVGYRSKSLPSHSSRPHVRKSHSMRTNSTFKPTNASTPSCQNNNNNNTNMNPYAQPIKALRSNSTAGSRERRKKISSNKSPSNLVNLSQTAAAVAPPIPEPDYSCSDTDGESDEDRKILNNTIITRFHAAQQPIENSGNSNTSGSSSGSSSVPHSFSVEEIQKGRSLLKSSKSYPDDFLKKQNDLDSTIIEDGDNSSSGVSSDQELPTGIGNGSGSGGGNFNDRLTQTLPSPKTQRQPTSLLSRHAVSLAQLPPPIEADSDEKEEFCLPPPPEFDINNINEANLEQGTVLAPPPQFSDNRQVTRVRIVGAVPKTPTTTTPTVTTTTTTLKNKMKQGRLHSQ